MSVVKKPYLIMGGIGDFIQCLDTVISFNSDPHAKFVVITHFKGAKAFFAPFVDLSKFEFNIFELSNPYDNLPASVKDSWVACPRSIFQEFPYPHKVANPFSNDKEIIGIHAFGSKFAKNSHRKSRIPEKRISLTCVQHLINENYNYLFFGSVEETHRYEELLELGNVKFINHPDIWQSLSHVQLCKKIIAVDSALKSLSLAKKIKTYLVLGDFKDDVRDEFFINPYLDTGYLELCKVKNPPRDDQAIIPYLNKAIYGIDMVYHPPSFSELVKKYFSRLFQKS